MVILYTKLGNEKKENLQVTDIAFHVYSRKKESVG